MKDFDCYQKWTDTTAIYPEIGKKFIYPILGLSGECGELSEKVKKIMRDKEGQPDESDIVLIKRELGDIMWCIARVATEFGLSLTDVVVENINKLESRKERGKLQGSGDNR